MATVPKPAPICTKCWPTGWPETLPDSLDVVTATSCAHGRWTRPAP